MTTYRKIDQHTIDPDQRLILNLTMEAYRLHGEQCDEEASQRLELILEMNPDVTAARFLKGLIALSHGDFETGWPLFELRHERPDVHPFVFRHRTELMWDGEPTDEKLLLWGAEGLGDTVQMLRFIPEVKKLCPNLEVEVQFPLLRLTKINYPDVKVTAVGMGEPKFDLQCSLLSLPLVLKKHLKDISGEAYLKTSPILVEDWKLRKPQYAYLGLCWQGNRANARDLNRSLPVTVVNPLAKAFDFVALQREHTPFDDVADMAALIENLEFVVTVDTLVAHLAGAMGKRTLLMLGTDCDWRWLQQRKDSPWYDSIEIFRQREPGDWSNVVQEVIAKGRQSHPYPSIVAREG